MRFKRHVAALAASLLATVSWAAQAEGPKAAGPAEAPVMPLVRMDLLTAAAKDGPATLRDIFRPKTVPRPAVQAPPRPAPKVAPPPSEAAPTFGLNLTYLGMVESGGRRMALVMIGGMTLPVSLGEEASPGYRVIRIAQDSIDIEAANGLRKTFARQGARP